MKRINALIKADLKQFFRDKADIFWVFAWPILWILMVAFVFVPPGAGSPITLDVGIVNYDSSSNNVNGTLLINVLEKVEYNGTRLFNVKIYNTTDDLVSDLKKGKLDGGIIIPDGFGKNLTLGQARLTILIGAKSPYSASINSGVLRGFLSEFSKRVALYKVNITLYYISKYNYTFQNYTGYVSYRIPGYENKTFIDFLRDFFYGIAEPIIIEYKEVKPEALANRANILGWYTLGAIGMMLLYSGMVYGAGFLVSDREQGVLYRLLASPMSDKEYLAGRVLAGIVICGLASLVALLTGLAVGAHIIWNPSNPMHWLVIVLFINAAVMSLGFGAILAPIVKTSRGASSLGTSLGLLLAFTTGIWFPKEWLPSWMKIVADYSPFTWTIDAIRGIMVYGLSFAELETKIMGSLITSLIIVIVAWILWTKTLRKYTER